MKSFWNVAFSLLLALALGVVPAAAQKQKKRKSSPPDTSTPAPPPIPDNQKIDEEISEVLGYWQIGEVDQMQKYYSPDVIVITGAWEPPVSGWPAYKTAYQTMRARIQGGQFDRTNTLIKVQGTCAWATYQWEYFVMIDGSQDDIRGKTTLIFEKQGDDWLIALDHTSVVSNTPQKAPGSAPAPTSVPPAANPAPNPQR
ncbi:MAG: nuclear transport factor 2 family protein [Candidatus Acidiferrales bacterium]